MLQRQLRVNAKLQRVMDRLGVHVFTDRDVLTGVPYRLVFGKPVPDFLRRLLTRKFADVCVLLEPVPYWHHDGVRYDNLDLTKALFPVYRRVCEEAGVPLVVQEFVEEPQLRNDLMLEKLGIKPLRGAPKFTQLAA